MRANKEVGAQCHRWMEGASNPCVSSLPSEGGQRPADGGAGGRVSGEGFGWMGPLRSAGWNWESQAKSLTLGARKAWRSSSSSVATLGKRFHLSGSVSSSVKWVYQYLPLRVIYGFSYLILAMGLEEGFAHRLHSGK